MLNTLPDALITPWSRGLRRPCFWHDWVKHPHIYVDSGTSMQHCSECDLSSFAMAYLTPPQTRPRVPENCNDLICFYLASCIHEATHISCPFSGTVGICMMYPPIFRIRCSAVQSMSATLLFRGCPLEPLCSMKGIPDNLLIQSQSPRDSA